MAGLEVEVVVEGDLLIGVGVGVCALGVVVGRVGDLDKAPAVEHKARPITVFAIATPELNATQKWRAAFMGDRAFTRARAAGNKPAEAGHARAKAEADIALSLPAEYRD